jgi:hypothetical protein
MSIVATSETLPALRYFAHHAKVSQPHRFYCPPTQTFTKNSFFEKISTWWQNALSFASRWKEFPTFFWDNLQKTFIRFWL